MSIELSTIFKSAKPIIGMVHLPASPGQPQFKSKPDLKAMISAVAADVKALQDGGVDGLLFCNESDLPYTTRVNSEVGAWTTFMIGAVHDQLKQRLHRVHLLFVKLCVDLLQVTWVH